MTCIGIVGGGPNSYIPNIQFYTEEISIWIGTENGAITLLEQGIAPDIAVGDFDSIHNEDKEKVKEGAKQFKAYPVEKDESDLELAISEAIHLNPTTIYFFGVTGGRLDHELANIQLLYKIKQLSVHGIIVDNSNQLELWNPGVHELWKSPNYPYVSFLPFSSQVKGISLSGFYYKLNKADISWGSTLCISNKLISEKGTFSFDEGILIVIKSRDVSADPL